MKMTRAYCSLCKKKHKPQSHPLDGVEYKRDGFKYKPIRRIPLKYTGTKPIVFGVGSN